MNSKRKCAAAADDVKRVKKKRKRCIHSRLVYYCRPCGGKGTCEHNSNKSRCSICNGAHVCPHGRPRSRCKKCNGGEICSHGIVKSSCRHCGTLYCEHGKQRYHCYECRGAGICVHDKRRSHCRECDGVVFCEHDRQRHVCKECGGSSICTHGQYKTMCAECGGASLCDCGKIKQVDGFCKTCHPDYIPTGSGVSKAGCRFLDAVERETKATIQHSHYDQITKALRRDEFRPPELSKYSVDGYDATNKTVYEFLGLVFHGHPSTYDPCRAPDDNKTYYGARIDLLYQKTEQRMRELAAAGYCIIYIWEDEFLRYEQSGALSTVASRWHVFDGHLRPTWPHLSSNAQQ